MKLHILLVYTEYYLESLHVSTSWKSCVFQYISGLYYNTNYAKRSWIDVAQICDDYIDKIKPTFEA